MQTVILPRAKPEYFEDVEKQLRDIFYNVLFAPLLASIHRQDPVAAFNATAPLLEALRSGRVQYSDGVFSGRLSASIAKELRRVGSHWDERTSTYKLDATRVPVWVKGEAAVYQIKAKMAHEEIESNLDNIEKTLNEVISRNKVNAAPLVEDINAGWRQSTRVISVAPQLTPGALEQIADEYSTNLGEWALKYGKDEILKLRQEVEENARAGYRFDSLMGRLQRRFDVSKSKATFLAQQETSLFMSKFHESRAEAAGLPTYRWLAAMDARTRPSHRALNGKVFYFDQPPVVDPKTGRRGNPGEDFGCRCQAQLLLDRAQWPGRMAA